MAMFQIYALDEQIKALPTIDTASGSIASFDTDLTENLVEVKCQIVAKQASGTPSPSNPLPITTYTEMNVLHCGKNFLPSLDTETKNGFTVTNNNGVLTLSGTAGAITTFSKSFSLPAGNYNLCALNSVSAGTNYRMEITKDGNQVVNAYLNSVNRNANFTLTECSDLIFNFIVSYNTTGGNYTLSPQITLGSGVQLTFNPYNGTTANIPFGQTVANGVLDITSGKLDIIWSAVDLGSLTWTYDSTYNRFLSNAFNIDGLPSTRTMKCLCSCYQTISDGRPLAQVPNNSIYNGGGSKTLIVHDNRFTVGTDFKTAVSGQYCTYKLETPIIIQLDSITLQALLNENNIWCDTGDTEVKFLLTVGKKIS